MREVKILLDWFEKIGKIKMKDKKKFESIQN